MDLSLPPNESHCVYVSDSFESLAAHKYYTSPLKLLSTLLFPHRPLFSPRMSAHSSPRYNASQAYDSALIAPPIECQVFLKSGVPLPGIHILLKYGGYEFDAYTSTTGVTNGWSYRGDLRDISDDGQCHIVYSCTSWKAVDTRFFWRGGEHYTCKLYWAPNKCKFENIPWSLSHNSQSIDSQDLEIDSTSILSFNTNVTPWIASPNSPYDRGSDSPLLPIHNAGIDIGYGSEGPEVDTSTDEKTVPVSKLYLKKINDDEGKEELTV